MAWKTCLRVAWARRMRPACSISQRSRPSAVATAPYRVPLYLLPGWTRALGSKAIQRWPQIEEQLIDGGAAGIQQPQGLGLQGVWQANGKGKRLGRGHGMPPPARLIFARPAVVVVGFYQVPHSHRAEPPP